MPSVSGNAQKGIAVLAASAEMPKIHVWDAMQIVRDPYSGAGAGKVTITATALVSPLYVPHGTSQVVGSSSEALVRAIDGFASRASPRVPGDLFRRGPGRA